MRFRDRLFAASAYVFGVPALYIVLTDNRSKKNIGYHGAQAFVLWVIFFAVFFALRFIINLIWSRSYIPSLEMLSTVAVLIMGCYAFFCGYRSMRGQDFNIPR